MPPAANGYGVALVEAEGSWRVAILDAAGEPVMERSYDSEERANVFASTVRQHIEWLSEERFRAYYRIEG